MNSKAVEYVTHEVEAADRVRLVELLYQRVFSDLETARTLWTQKPQCPEAIPSLVHAQSVLHELQLSLNYAEGGDLAVTLGRLYEYMQFTLMQLVIQRQGNELGRLEEVQSLVATLSDAWSSMAQRHKESEPALRTPESLVA